MTEHQKGCLEVLELFCGRGGWSKGFAEQGHNCTGIDIENYGYPYRFIKADLFDWIPDKHYDVILASPPCTEFAWLKHISCKSGYDERQGLDLVWRTFHLIEKIKPTYWVIENVKGLGEFLDKPTDIVRYGKNKGRKEAWLWGSFPKLGMIPPIDFKINWKMTSSSDKDKLSERSEIPIQLSRAVCEAVTQ